MKKTFDRTFTRKITLIAVMSAFATILMFIDFSVPFMPGFLKFDFSDMPALITSFAVSPWGGVIVCLVKNLFNLLNTQTSGVGELSNFLLGCFFVVPSGLIYKYKRTFSGALIGCIVGILSMSLLSVFTNYYIVYPFYTNLMPMQTILNMYNAIYSGVGDSLIKALFIFNMPFTALKGVAASIITIIVYKRISKLINKDKKGTTLKKEREQEDAIK